MKIEIYSKNGCPYCEMAKNWLKIQKLEFNEIKLDDNQERQKFYESVGEGVKSVPQIFLVDNEKRERIGGYQDLMSQKDRFLAMKVSLTNDF